MMTFGFATLIDVLSWIVVVSLALKVIATPVLLIVNKEKRDQPGRGPTLWRVTKITPIIAVPCLFTHGSSRCLSLWVWRGIQKLGSVRITC